MKKRERERLDEGRKYLERLCDFIKLYIVKKGIEKDREKIG